MTAVGTAWSPNYVEIAVGGSVTFTWAGMHDLQVAGYVAAPATSGNHTVSFPAPGTYTYPCSIHPGMVGTVDVQ